MCVCVCVCVCVCNYFFEVSKILDYYFPITVCLRTGFHVKVQLTVTMLLASQNHAVSQDSAVQLLLFLYAAVNEGRYREAKECQ